MGFVRQAASRLHDLQSVCLTSPEHIAFRRWARLYRSRFPLSELAPLTAVEYGLRQDETVISGYQNRKSDWAGFTLCEDYECGTLLAYLATSPDYEGQGLAKRMVDEQTEQALSADKPYFWLEANPKLWRFYHRLGFARLDMPYAIPNFNDDGTEAMALFVKTHASVSDTDVDKKLVKEFVSELFLEGYYVASDDPRYLAQMKVIEQYRQSGFALVKTYGN